MKIAFIMFVDVLKGRNKAYFINILIGAVLLERLMKKWHC